MRTRVPALCLASAVLPLSQAQVVNFLDDLPYDENNHLSTHVLAYPDGACARLLKTEKDSLDGSFGHRFVAVGGAAFYAVFGDESNIPIDVKNPTDCPAVCLEKGTPKAVAPRPMPHRYRVQGLSMDAFLGSDSCGKVEYGFTNYNERPVNIYWIPTDGGVRVFNMKLEVGERETRFIFSYVGHSFEFEDEETHENLGGVTIESNGVVGIKNYKMPRPFQPDEIDELVLETLDAEWGRHKHIRRTFSALGFQKGRLPDDIYASLGAYYYNNRNRPHTVHEEWKEAKGVFVNYWEIDVNFIQIPWVLKKMWQGRLRELVEAWTGVELETTDMYGLRQYESGARLLTHVDRHTTHAASLIMNIAQGDVSRPWTVEVHDHADRLHEVVMEPGDIVYYESARCLHGRNTPLQIGPYVNLFTHYRPLNDPNWFRRDNPEGTPEPLMDIGKCNLVGKIDEYSQGAVVCENNAIGPHLSPSMFKANSGADLFSWWKNVSPLEQKPVDSTRTSDEL